MRFVGGGAQVNRLVTLVFLAASRRDGSVCYAGKDAGVGRARNWVRPVSAPDGSVDTRHFILEGTHGERAQKLDIVQLGLSRHVPCYGYQCENWVVDPSHPPRKTGSLPKNQLPEWCDTPAQLWHNGYSSSSGENDRVPKEQLARDATKGSLYLVELKDLRIQVKEDDDGNMRVRGVFTYRSDPYNLAVTDPDCERWAKRRGVGEHDLSHKRTLGCISLGGLFHGYAYKLLAGVYTL